jgi:hypothetical protein
MPQLPPENFSRPHWLLRLILILFVCQLGWLAWQFRGDFADLAHRSLSGAWGNAVREEDPFYRWVAEINRAIPPNITYVFLDNYEVGKEVEARYHLFPRRHLLLLPQAPPSLLFYFLKQNQVSYILVRDPAQASGSGLKAVLELGAARQMDMPGPGLAYQVDARLIKGGFYD